MVTAIRESLKKDKSPFTKDGNTFYFAVGYGIDCFHRLNLTERDLELLLEIGKLNMEAELEETSLDMGIKCTTVAEHLYRKFKAQFDNPFSLDVQTEPFTGAPYRLRYCFYDYNYSYYLEYHQDKCFEDGRQGAWSIYCTNGALDGTEETEVEMDSVD